MYSVRQRLVASVAGAALAVLALGSASVALAAGGGPSSSPGNSASTITGSFSADCTDFSTTSSKDLSHVEFFFADGSQSKVESFPADPKNYSYAGDAVISYTLVKAGTTTNRYDCTPTPPAPQCSNGVDDADPEDAIADYPNDPGCSSADDNDETDAPPAPQCSNGVDDADPEDAIADYPNDPGCSSAEDDSEIDPVVAAQCNDGSDNDGDGKIDFAGGDPGCTDANDDSESPDPAIPCEHDGLLGLITGEDEATVAKQLYDGGLNAIPVLQDPYPSGPISEPLDGVYLADIAPELAPLDEVAHPAIHEGACAGAMLDQNANE